jgi:hypothetical protein
MAILTRAARTAQINADIDTNGTGAITGSILNTVLNNLNDSLQDRIQSYTSVQRDAIAAPFNGMLIYNSTTARLETYNGGWAAVGFQYQGGIALNANPNFPAGKVGDVYAASSAGLIGGASGYPLSTNDLILCTASNAGGTFASVGSSWRYIYSGSVAHRIDKTFILSGVPTVRKSDGTSDANPLMYSTGAEFVIMFPDEDLKATGTGSILFPTGYRFFVTEVGVIATDADTVTVQPTVSFGVDGDLDRYKAAALTTGLTADGARFVPSSLLVNNGQTSVGYEVTVAATATTLTGRVYFKGFLVENQ